MGYPYANQLTKAREAMWNAIRRWAALVDSSSPTQSVFRRMDEFNGDAGTIEQFQPIGLADLPYIGILPTNANPAWQTNRMQQFSQLYAVTIVSGYLDELEQLTVDVWDALYQATDPNRTPSYVKDQTGYHPARVDWTYAIAEVESNQVSYRAHQGTLVVGLRMQRDPLGPITP